MESGGKLPIASEHKMLYAPEPDMLKRKGGSCRSVLVNEVAFFLSLDYGLCQGIMFIDILAE